MSKVGEQVIALVAEKAVGDEPIGLDSRVADLGIDSLEVVEIIFAMEDTFGIRIELNAEGVANEFSTVRDIVAAVEERVAKAT